MFPDFPHMQYRREHGTFGMALGPQIIWHTYKIKSKLFNKDKPYPSRANFFSADIIEGLSCSDMAALYNFMPLYHCNMQFPRCKSLLPTLPVAFMKTFIYS